MRIAHATYVHDALDVRIYWKQCRSLAAAGHEVHLIAPDPPSHQEEGVQFHALSPTTQATPWGRLKHWRRQVDRHLRSIAPDVVHVHDPLLIPVAIAARSLGARAVYDAHEEHVLQAARLVHLPWWRRRLLAAAFGRVEDLARNRAHHIIAATPRIAEHFPPQRTTVVRNLPIPGEFESIPPLDPTAATEPLIAYIGGLTRSRGIIEMIDAIKQVDPPARLALAGRFDESATRTAAEARPGWSRVDDLGWLGRDGICDLLTRCRAGVVALRPIPDFQVSWPVKLFEYMAAARPVIASDFPLWRSIIEPARCGVLVNPTDPAAIAGAMSRLLSDLPHASELGHSGRAAVHAEYSWNRDLPRLLSVYEHLA